MEKDQYSYGFDAQAGEYGNLVTKGIIDPTKVVRSAIQNAASVAGLLITTEAMVAEVPKKKMRRRRCRAAAAWAAAWTSSPTVQRENAKAREKSRAFSCGDISTDIAKTKRPHTKRRAFIRRRLIAVAVVARTIRIATCKSHYTADMTAA